MTISEYFEQYYDTVCNGDLNTLDQFFHIDSPIFAGIKGQYEAIRQQLKMSITIESIELVAKQDDLLVVRDNILFEGDHEGQVTKNRSGNLHVLTRKDQGEWRMQSTAPLSVEAA